MEQRTSNTIFYPSTFDRYFLSFYLLTWIDSGKSFAKFPEITVFKKFSETPQNISLRNCFYKDNKEQPEIDQISRENLLLITL